MNTRDFSVQIAAFRRHLGNLTQAQLAAELGLKRGAVANWEGGAREPSRENYAALADLAKAKNLPSFAEFFLEKIESKKLSAYPAVRAYLESMKVAPAVGDLALRRLIELSRLEGIEFSKTQAERIIEAKRTMNDQRFSDFFYKVVTETEIVRNLRLIRDQMPADRHPTVLPRRLTAGILYGEAKIRDAMKKAVRKGLGKPEPEKRKD